MRLARALVLIAMSFAVSGAPQVLAAALDDDCCTEVCEGALDGKHCPPNCDEGLCSQVHASILATERPSIGPSATTAGTVVLSQTSPRLPGVTGGLFHPPRA